MVAGRGPLPGRRHILIGAVALFTVGGVVSPGAAGRAGSVTTAQTDAVIAAGRLVHHRLANDLFHIDNLWMRVEPDTVFHRWLARGAGRTAAIAVTVHPDGFADRVNTRLLTGRLIHQTAPNASATVHIVFLQDEVTGSLGAVTFETTDPVIAAAFDLWADTEVSIVVEIRGE